MNNPWEQISVPQTNVNARRIDHTHSLDLFWAKDHMGHYLFICELSSQSIISKNDIPEIKGIQIYSIISEDDAATSRFILLLNDQSNWEIFLSLCNDLKQATRNVQDSSSAIQIILKRLKRWQEFLKIDRPDVLSEEEIRGLIGELLFIKQYLIPNFGITQSIKFWQGPEGLPQDFNINNGAIEVKSHLGSSSQTIKISSLDQLCPTLPEMYLMVFTLGKTTPDDKQALNLLSIARDIRKTLEDTSYDSLERFNDLLHMVGYTDSDRYLEFNYIMVDKSMYKIVEGFPRICACDVIEGIVQLSYSISLNACQPFKGHPTWMEI